MAMIMNAASSQVRFGDLGGLMNKLASIYNNAGGEEGNGLTTIDSSPMLDQLATLFPGGKEAALKAVLNTASQCDKTFWRRFGQLKKHKENNRDNVVNVNGIEVLTIESEIDLKLALWLNTQNGYHYANNMDEYGCGVKAYKRMGSIEQLALEGIGVTFDPNLHKKAMNIRAANKSKKNAGKKRNGIMGLIRG